MKPIVLFSALALVAVLAGCTDDAPTASPNAVPFYADQQYYPTEQGTTWTYRIDTISSRGQVTADVRRRTCRITGPKRVDSVDYVVQVNETARQDTLTVDTVYIRKDGNGVFLSSPQLRLLSQAPVIPQLPISFPKEILVLPQYVQPGLGWNILNIEINLIPLFPMYFRVNAVFVAREDLHLDGATYRNCAKVRIDIDARFPNPQNPQDILNPLIIKESAYFWLTRPFGLVAGDGSDAVFALLRGQIPITLGASTHVRHEVIGMNIVQPSASCP
jgi:hypothetical protein